MSLPDFALPENSVRRVRQPRTSESYEAFVQAYNLEEVQPETETNPTPRNICPPSSVPDGRDLEYAFKEEIEKCFYDETERKHFNPDISKVLETAAKFWIRNREFTQSWDKDEFVDWISEISFHRVMTAPRPLPMLVSEIKRTFDASKKICARRNELVLSGMPTKCAQDFMMWISQPHEGFSFTPFPVGLLGKIPTFSPSDEDMIIDFVKSQNGIYRESEFVDWSRFADRTGNSKFHPEQVRYKYEKLPEKRVTKRVGKECMKRHFGYLKQRNIVRESIIQNSVPMDKALSFIKGSADFDPNDYAHWIMLASKAEWNKCLRFFRNIVRDCASCLNPLKETKLYYLMFRSCVWSKRFETDEAADLKVQIYTHGFMDMLVMTDVAIQLSKDRQILKCEAVTESLIKLYPLIGGRMEINHKLNAFDAAVYKCVKDRESSMSGRAKLFMHDNLKSRLFKPRIQTSQLDPAQINEMIEEPLEQPCNDSEDASDTVNHSQTNPENRKVTREEWQTIIVAMLVYNKFEKIDDSETWEAIIKQSQLQLDKDPAVIKKEFFESILPNIYTLVEFKMAALVEYKFHLLKK